MNYILMDIKKFLKKLETGQMEIEAGQWELHKDITNLKNAIQELKQLKKDLQMVKQHGLKQTDLIKELQYKLNLLERMYENEQGSSSSTENTSCSNNKSTVEPLLKMRKKNKSRVFCSGKTTKFAQDIDKKGKSGDSVKCKSEKRVTTGKESRQKSCKRNQHQCVSRQRSKVSPRDHSILQRYLQDSVKYVDKEKCQKKCPVSKKSFSTMSRHWTSETIDEELRNNYYRRNRGRSKFSQLHHSRKGNPKKSPEAIMPVIPGDFACPVRPKKITPKSGFLKHDRRHGKVRPLYYCNTCKKSFCYKNHLKKHAKTHQKLSKSFRGYRCSYCDKICSSPENLTAHLKRCRIIIKTHSRKKKPMRR